MPAPKGNFFSLVGILVVVASAAGIISLFLDTWPLVLFFGALILLFVAPSTIQRWKQGENKKDYPPNPNE